MLGAGAGVADASVEEAMDTVTRGRFAAESSSYEAEFVLIDKISDTGEAYTRDAGRRIEESGGNLFNAEDDAKVASTDGVELLKLGQRPARVLAHKAYAREDACLCDEDLVVRSALPREEELEVIVDGGDETVKVVLVGVMIAVVNS